MLGEMALNRTQALMAGKQGQDEGTHGIKTPPTGREGGGQQSSGFKGGGMCLTSRDKSRGTRRLTLVRQEPRREKWRFFSPSHKDDGYYHNYQQ